MAALFQLSPPRLPFAGSRFQWHRSLMSNHPLQSFLPRPHLPNNSQNQNKRQFVVSSYNTVNQKSHWTRSPGIPPLCPPTIYLTPGVIPWRELMQITPSGCFFRIPTASPSIGTISFWYRIFRRVTTMLQESFAFPKPKRIGIRRASNSHYSSCFEECGPPLFVNLLKPQIHFSQFTNLEGCLLQFVIIGYLE